MFRKKSRRYILPPQVFQQDEVNDIASALEMLRTLPVQAATKKASKSKEAAKRIPEMETYVAKRANAPVNYQSQAKRSEFSINNHLAPKVSTKKASEKSVPTQELPQQAFNQEQLMLQWKIFTDQIKAQKNKGAHLALTYHEPQIKEDGTSILYTVPNNVMLREFESEKLNLLAHLKKGLNNHHIFIETQVMEIQKERSLYLPQEIFDYMSKKNPLLDTLKKNLDLNIEF